MSKRENPKQLTLFGRWIETLNSVFGTNQTKLAQAIGISQSAISRAMREGGAPEIETVHRLWNEYTRLAAEQNLADLLTVATQESFFESAWHVSERQRQVSEQRLLALQVVIRLQASLDACGEEGRVMRNTIAVLRAEIEILKRLPPEEREKWQNPWSGDE